MLKIEQDNKDVKWGFLNDSNNHLEYFEERNGSGLEEDFPK